jgi:hypothetical protein
MEKKKKAIFLLWVIFFSMTIQCQILPLRNQFTKAGNSESYMNINMWEADGNAICTASGIQKNPQMCSDGAGGAIITWLDYRIGSIWEIYAQRINATGAVLWTIDGIAITMIDAMDVNPQICSDGIGGAIIIWSSYLIYAQRINATGALLWGENGTNVCNEAIMPEQNPQICSDGFGGAIITWQEKRSGALLYYDIYAQRINASGALLWNENGTLLRAGSPTAYNEMNPQVCSDGDGGAIFTWDEYKSAGHGWVFAQRINATGGVSWIANGTVICGVGTYFHYPQICSDGGGGAIIVWHDNHMGSQIYAQRITAAGAISWTANGIAISSDIFTTELYPQIWSDGSGGAIIAWETWRGLTQWDIEVQRINGTGTALWPLYGISISNASNDQKYPKICSDNAGGAIITWQDNQNGINTDIYAQRINAAGIVLWATNGTAVSTASGYQVVPTLCSYGIGGVIISWMDNRSGVHDIYANKIGPPALDNPPISNNPPNATYTPFETGARINWFLWDDVAPGNYAVFRNGTVYSLYNWSNTWISGLNLAIPIDTSVVGVYNYTIYFNDTTGQYGNPDTVWIEIIPLAPSVEILFPFNGNLYEEYEIIPIITNITGYDLTNVEFYANSTYIDNLQYNGTLFIYDWTPTVGFAGIIFLQIRAYNIYGKVNDTGVVWVNITPYTPLAEHADLYIVTITNSTGHSQDNYTQGQQITYQATIRGDLGGGTYLVTAQTNDPTLYGYLTYNDSVIVFPGKDTIVTFYFNIPAGAEVPSGEYIFYICVWTDYAINHGLCVDFISGTFTVI